MDFLCIHIDSFEEGLASLSAGLFGELKPLLLFGIWVVFNL